MTFFTSGTPTIDSSLTLNVCQFFETKYYPSIANYDVEIYYCDLNEDGVKGWQEKNGDEFLIHIHDKLESIEEHIRTIFHELVHCIHDIRGLSEENKREELAYSLEEQFYKEYVTQNKVSTFFPFPSNIVYYNRVVNQSIYEKT